MTVWCMLLLLSCSGTSKGVIVFLYEPKAECVRSYWNRVFSL